MSGREVFSGAINKVTDLVTNFSWRVVWGWLKQHWAVIFLVSLWLGLVGANFPATGVWLMGYDSLLPELDLPLWGERNFFSIWQDYRGLGVANTIMEGTELTRLPWVLLARLILGARLVRFSWIAAMILLGTLACYCLTKQWLKLIFVERRKLTAKIIKLAALVSASFYLLNPAMVQFFYTPLESFSSWYGFLPLVLWVFLKFLRDSKPLNLALLVLVAFFSASAYHVQTFFVVLLMTLAILALGFLWRRGWRKYWRRVLLALASVVIANAFWFLPLVVTTLYRGNDFTQTKQNQVSTPQVQEMNYSYGTLDKIAALYGYWFEYREYNYADNSYTPYLGQWQTYWQLAGIESLGYLQFALVLLGFAGAIFLVRRRSFLLSMIAVLGLGILMLTSGKGLILGAPFRWLSNLPLLSDIFRVAFTKWSIVVSLGYAFGQGVLVVVVYLLGKNLLSKLTLKSLTAGTALTIGLMALIRVAPLYQGELFGWQVQVEFPEEYQQLSEFMKTLSPEATVAYLPMPNYWGWLFYSWGYRGSGFMWQIIKQPLLDRNFDAWSLTNQSAYQELNLAFERNETALLEQVLAKYDLELVIVDENIISTNVGNQQVQAETNHELKQALAQIGARELFHQGQLWVYALPNYQRRERLEIENNYQQVIGERLLGVKDEIYTQAGPYLLTPPEATDGVIYPFAGGQSERVTGVNCDNNQCRLQADLGQLQAGSNYHLIFPALEKGEAVTVSGYLYFETVAKVRVIFEPQLDISVAGQVSQLPQLKEWALDQLTATSEAVIVDFGDRKPYLVRLGEATDFAVTLAAGASASVKVAPATGQEDLSGVVSIPQSAVREFKFPATIWDELLKPLTLPVRAQQEVTANWQATAFSLTIDYPSAPVNCDVSGRGTITKTLLTQGAIYQSGGFANLCEHYTLQALSSLNDYLVQFRVANIAGQALQFFVIDGASGRLLLDQSLGKSEREQFFYLPHLQVWQGQQNSLLFYLNNKSYGQVSENELTQVRFIQYPIEYLGKIKIVSSEGVRVPPLNQRAYFIDNWQRQNASAYRAQLTAVPTNTSQEQLLILNRTFDLGWTARAKTTRGWQTLPHRRYNSWANAWVLPKDKTEAGAANPLISEVKVEFWPQKLVGWGALILAVELGAIGWAIYREKKGHRQQRNGWLKKRTQPKRLFH